MMGLYSGANLTTASTRSPFVVYRWANEGATATVAYTSAPDGGATARWGDSFSVTGAGVNSTLMVSGSSATNTVVFTTGDGVISSRTKLIRALACGASFR